jgi:O-antigen/teichoic acid export membrane protein
MTAVLNSTETVTPPSRPAQPAGPRRLSRPGRLSRVRVLLGRPATLTVFDQALSSGSNFAVAVVVARLAGARALGVFTIAYALWLFLASLHRSLVTDPMAIEGDARSSSAKLRLSTGLAADVLLGVSAAVVCLLLGLVLRLAGQEAFGSALVSVSPWLVALVVQDFWRWAGFMSARPDRSLINDAVFAVVQGVLFGYLLVEVDNPSTALVVGAWGVSAVVAALFGAWQFRLLPARSGAWSLLRSRWHVSGWLVGHELSMWGTSQGMLVLSGTFLGPAALGGLRAAQSLVSGPAMVLIQAGGSVGLPEASKAFAERGQLGLRRVTRRVTLAAAGSVALITLIVIVAGRPIMSGVYGPAFGKFHVAAALLGVSYAIGTIALGPIMALKVMRKTRPLLESQLVMFSVMMVMVAILAPMFGVNGTAAASVWANIAFSAVMTRAFSRARPSRIRRRGIHRSGVARHRRPT